MDSNFNPDAFLDATLTEPSTKRPPLPVAEYHGTVTKVASRPWTGKQDPTKSGIAIDVEIEVNVAASNPEYATANKINTLVMKDSIMIDQTENGNIDNSPGKNGKLRRYRDALDMNKPGDAFSFRAMVGRMIKVKTKQEPYEGEVYDRIDSIARA